MCVGILYIYIYINSRPRLRHLERSSEKYAELHAHVNVSALYS